MNEYHALAKQKAQQQQFTFFGSALTLIGHGQWQEPDFRCSSCLDDIFVLRFLHTILMCNNITKSIERH